MDKGDFESLQRGLAQAKAFVEGERQGFVVHDGVDIKAIRKAANKTQGQFAQTFRLPIGTVRDWEQGRCQPDAPARALLAMIAADPAAAEQLMMKASV